MTVNMAHENLTKMIKTQPIYLYSPVDREWKKSVSEMLCIPDSDISMTQELPSSSMVPLGFGDCICQNITSDGNCFFRCLSFAVFSTEKYFALFRFGVCNYMLMNTDEIESFLPPQYNGNVKQYLITTKMLNNRTWATEVEIHAAAFMLQTSIYVYGEHGWLRHAKESNTSDKGIYIFHKNKNHFDIVVDFRDHKESSSVPMGRFLYTDHVKMDYKNHEIVQHQKAPHVDNHEKRKKKKTDTAVLPETTKICQISGHEKKKFFKYCSEHSELGCQECLKDRHKHCKNLLSLDEAYFKTKLSPVMKTVRERIQQIAQIANEIVQNRRTCRSNVKTDVHHIILDINKATKEITGDIIEHKTDLLTRLNRDKEIILSDIKKEKKRIRRHKKRSK